MKVSSAERTIVDAATHPEWVGGGRQLAAVFVAYSERRDANPSTLLAELEHYGNGAAAKRIGFLAEQLWPDAAVLVERCANLKTLGHSKFDPSVATRGNLVTRWGLWLNARISDATHT